MVSLGQANKDGFGVGSPDCVRARPEVDNNPIGTGTVVVVEAAAFVLLTTVLLIRVEAEGSELVYCETSVVKGPSPPKITFIR
jgi:hypothetical protein